MSGAGNMEIVPVNRGIWAIGGATVFFAMAAGAILSILPVYMVTAFGATGFVVGLVEGAGIAVASVTLVFSGYLSDRLGNRKSLVMAGYGLSALIKLVFLLAGSLWVVAVARVVDRFSTALFYTPQDALVGDLSRHDRRGASYGLMSAANGLGATAGPLLAMAVLSLVAGGYRIVFWLTLVLAVLAFAIIALGVRERPPAGNAGRRGAAINWRAVFSLGPAYYGFLAVVVGVVVARMNEAFALLKALDLGLDESLTPLVFMAIAASQAVVAYPAGRLSDSFGRVTPLAAGIVAVALAHAILAVAAEPWQVFAAALLWGAHVGLTTGVLLALVADTSPPDLRGTAFGVYYLTYGVWSLVATVIAGAIWDGLGPSVMFFIWAGLSLLALAMLFLWRRRLGDRRHAGG